MPRPLQFRAHAREIEPVVAAAPAWTTDLVVPCGVKLLTLRALKHSRARTPLQAGAPSLLARMPAASAQRERRMAS